MSRLPSADVPGLVGLITAAPAEQARRELQAMVATLLHEPFYVSGTWSDEREGVYVGWVAHERSFADRMPVRNDGGDVVLVFAGEEYPERRSADQLTPPRPGVGGQGPRYLVHAYEDDPGFPAGLNGLFHGVVIDRRRGRTILFNDRYGIHRLYYHQAGDRFYFAAEAKAILAVRPELRNLDPGGIAEFFSCGCVLNNRSLFRRIFVLPGAAAWAFTQGRLETKATYFRPAEWEEQPLLGQEEYYQELRRVFSRNLSRYFSGDQPIGLALTGGLDTRAILAWRNPPQQSLPCYTFSSPYRVTQDARVARHIAAQCRQSHEMICADGRFLARFPDYAQRTVRLSEGCVDVGRSADLFVSERARQIAPVKIVGTYGSEVLTLAPAFAPSATVTSALSQEFEPDIRAAHATYSSLRRSHPVTFAAFRQSPWWHYGILALEQTQLTVRAPYLDSEFIRTVYRAPASPRAVRDVRRRLIRDANPQLADVATDRGDRPSGGSILPARLRRLWPEFTYRADYAYDYAMPQWLARIDHLFRPVRPERLFLGRHRAFHFRVWYRDELSQYVRDILLDSRTLSRPCYRRRELEAVVGEHVEGRRNHTLDIHRLLTFELLHRQFVDR